MGRWIASAPLVGRDGAIAALRAPARVAAVVRGEPGIGKTRLLAEVRRAAGLRPFFIGCMRAAASISHEPLLAMVRTLHQNRRISGDLYNNVMQAHEKDRLWYLHEALAAAASAGPLVQQIDDLQYADEKTLEALRYCIERLQDLPIRWQLATRSGNAAIVELLSSLERAGLLSVIELDGLEPDSLRALASSLRPEIAFDNQKIHELHHLTGGNPLYAELLLTANTWNSKTPPADLRHALEERFAGLSKAALNVAGWLAVQGAALSEPSLLSLSNASSAQLQVALGELADNRIVSIHKDGLFFRHDLLQAACYNLLTEKQRLRRHLALAQKTEDVWQKGQHLEGAREFAQSAAVFNSAGWKALERHAPTDALRAFRRALARVNPGSEQATEARGGCAAALFRLGKVADAKKDMRAFEASALQLEPKLRIAVRCHYVEAAWDESSDYEDITPILTLALKESRRFSKNAVPRLLCVLGSIYERRGKLRLARRTLEEGLRLCDDRLQLRQRIRLSSWLGVVLSRLGDSKTGIAMLETAAKEASAGGFSNELAQCSAKLCYVSHLVGAFDRFQHWCRIGLQAAGPKSKTTEALLKSNLASVAIDHGKLHEALGLTLSAETHIAERNPALRCRIIATQAQIYAMLGDFEMAENALLAYPAADLPAASRRAMDFTHGFVSELRGQLERALKWYAAAVHGLAPSAIREVYEVRAVTGAARCACSLQKTKTARRYLAKLSEVTKLGLPCAQASLQEARGYDLLLSGERSKAAEALLASGERQYPFWRARLKLAAARATNDRGLFRDAIDMFDAMGAVHASDGARALARYHGYRPGRKRAAHGVLSAREMSVAFLVANGKTNVEIGDLLQVSSKTVEYHIGNILSKSGLRSRVEIAAKIAAGKSLETAV